MHVKFKYTEVAVFKHAYVSIFVGDTVSLE